MVTRNFKSDETSGARRQVKGGKTMNSTAEDLLSMRPESHEQTYPEVVAEARLEAGITPPVPVSQAGKPASNFPRSLEARDADATEADVEVTEVEHDGLVDASDQSAPEETEEVVLPDESWTHEQIDEWAEANLTEELPTSLNKDEKLEAIYAQLEADEASETTED